MLLLTSCVKAGDYTITEPITGECNQEIITLAEEVLANGKLRWEWQGERLMELDSSQNMERAIKLQNNVRLNNILEQEKLKCQF